MHEASVTESIISSVGETLADQGITDGVTAVYVTVGVCQGIVGESMQFYFDLMKVGTPLEDAELIVTEEGMSARCDECGHQSDLEVPVLICTECGSAMTMTGGRDIIITSIEVTDHDEDTAEQGSAG
jgi:hydrogenase nickel incorporation protein HypA/HybF